MSSQVSASQFGEALFEARSAETLELSEWSTADEAVALTDADLETLKSQVNSETTRIGIEFDRNGDAVISARQFVGVIALPDGPTIQIEPKAAGDNLLHLLRYAQDVQPSTIEQQTGLGEGDSFIDALAALFNTELEEILRRGLHSEYQTTASEERRLRGRLNVQQQLQRQGPTPTKFECTYDELTTDTTANQAILYGTVILSRLVSDDRLRRELEWHIAQLRQSVTFRPVRPEELDQVEVSRLNEYYADILRLVEPVLRNLHVDNLRVGHRQSFSLLVNMNTVFEQVVERAVKRIADQQSDWSSEGQARTTNLIRGTPTVRMYPDFVVKRDGRPGQSGHNETIVVGDAKWKTGSVSNDDIYQLTSYVLAREAPGLLIYPEQDGAVETDYEIDREWPLQIVELPTDTDASDYADFVETLERSLRDTIVDAVNH